MGWITSKTRLLTAGPRPEARNKSLCSIHTIGNFNLAPDGLPFIPTSEVVAQREKGDEAKLWLVVNNFVFDCSEFVHIHPGGEMVIKSLQGWDSSWQFWRFHKLEHLENFGKGLVIGRTENVENKYSERSKYIGLSGIRTYS